MSDKNLIPHTFPAITKIAEELCKPAPFQTMIYESKSAISMPSLTVLSEIMNRLRAAIFPGYYGQTKIESRSLPYHLAANLDTIYRLLSEQILCGLNFSSCDASSTEGASASSATALAREKALAFMDQVPIIRNLLAGDVNAAFEGDPAAKSPGETIFCYPSIHAMTNHRIAHALYTLQVPLIPRIISEMSHSFTGIDLNPGASIGEEFFIDHGTGVVIGETCIIGKRCRLYQGVTLGAVSFPKGDDGTLIKGEPRHPILEDNIIVYAGATILGRITIGSGSVIGGNVWLTNSVPENSRVIQRFSELVEQK